MIARITEPSQLTPEMATLVDQERQAADFSSQIQALTARLRGGSVNAEDARGIRAELERLSGLIPRDGSAFNGVRGLVSDGIVQATQAVSTPDGQASSIGGALLSTVASGVIDGMMTRPQQDFLRSIPEQHRTLPAPQQEQATAAQLQDSFRRLTFAQATPEQQATMLEEIRRRGGANAQAEIDSLTNQTALRQSLGQLRQFQTGMAVLQNPANPQAEIAAVNARFDAAEAASRDVERLERMSTDNQGAVEVRQNAKLALQEAQERQRTSMRTVMQSFVPEGSPITVGGGITVPGLDTVKNALGAVFNAGGTGAGTGR